MRRSTQRPFVFHILAFCLFIDASAEAQSGKSWSIGPEAGVNFSMHKWNPDPFYHHFKPGVVAGVFLTYSSRPAFGITAKALFSQRGDVIDSEDNNGNPLQYKTTLNYLEVPIVGRYFLIKEGKFRPNLFAGPSFAFLMGGSTKVGNANTVKIANYSIFELGVTGGLGLNYEIANETRLLLDARYTYGLSDAGKASPIGSASIYNRSISISAGVSFGI